jgi:hypothetical protein
LHDFNTPSQFTTPLEIIRILGRIIEHEEQAKLWSAILRRATQDISGEMMHLPEFGNSNENFKVFDGAKTSPLIWRQRASNSIWRQSAQNMRPVLALSLLPTHSPK